mgnify:FL=1
MQLLGVDLSRSSYTQLECGLYNIKVSEFLALSTIFEVGIEQFFEGFQIPPK